MLFPFPYDPPPGTGWCATLYDTTIPWSLQGSVIDTVNRSANVLVGLGLVAMLAMERRRWRQAGSRPTPGSVLLLPVYYVILSVFAISSLLECVVGMFANEQHVTWSPEANWTPASGIIHGRLRTMRAVYFGLLFAAFHFAVDGIAILLLQPSLGIRALKKSFLISAIWGLVCWVAFILAFHFGVVRTVAVAQDALLWVFYTVIVFTPERRLPRRPALVYYARFSFIILGGYSVCGAFFFAGYTDAACALDVIAVINDVAVPFVLMSTLRKDSAYWQAGVQACTGYGPRAAVRGSSLQKRPYWPPGFQPKPPNKAERSDSSVGVPISSPLLDVQLSMAAAAELAVRLDEHRSIPLLNHTMVSLSPNKVLGAGGTARVYEGKWNGKRVAVKMVFCMDITPDHIQQIIAEGGALGGINDPNVVEVYGIAVAPPSVCLVLERCERSLRALLDDGPAFRALTLRDKLQLCIGAGKGVVCLHRQDPPVRHNDIKATNFLLDVNGVVKIADLGLSVAGTRSMDSRTALISDAEVRTCNWLAPEMACASPSEPVFGTTASDVYSLGVTFWEVFTGKIPFADMTYINVIHQAAAANVSLVRSVQEWSSIQVLVRAAVAVLKLKPTLPDSLHPEVAVLLQEMWALDPFQRPTALEVQQRLEAIAEGLAHV